jgi:hypothetical protein
MDVKRQFTATMECRHCDEEHTQGFPSLQICRSDLALAKGTSVFGTMSMDLFQSMSVRRMGVCFDFPPRQLQHLHGFLASQPRQISRRLTETYTTITTTRFR